MTNPDSRQLSKIIHIASPPEAIIWGLGISHELVPLTPGLSSILRSVMMALVKRGYWSIRPYHDSPKSYVYERKDPG